MRVVLSKIQILGLVVLSNQIDHDIRVTNAVTDRFLVERIKEIGFTLPTFPDCSEDKLHRLRHGTESCRSLHEKLWLKSY